MPCSCLRGSREAQSEGKSKAAKPDTPGHAGDRLSQSKNEQHAGFQQPELTTGLLRDRLRRAACLLREAGASTSSSTHALREDLEWLSCRFKEMAALQDDRLRDMAGDVAVALSGGPDEAEDIFYDAPTFSDAELPHSSAEACPPAADKLHHLAPVQALWPHWADSERAKAVHALIPELRQAMPAEWQVQHYASCAHAFVLSRAGPSGICVHRVHVV